MKMPKIDLAIEQCKEHLQETASFGTPIEDYLTRYLLILICSEFERVIKDTLVVRASLTNDANLETFFRNASRNIVRSIRTGGIAEVLGLYGQEYKTRFTQRIEGKPAKDAYQTIVANRNDPAHAEGAKVTLTNLENYYEQAHLILDELQNVLLAPTSPVDANQLMPD